MEGSKSESMGLNPQLFINEAINTIEDYVDAAFEFYGQEASKILKIDGSDSTKSQDLSNEEKSSVYSDQEMKDGFYDQDLDAQLDSLRDKLNLVGKRSAELDSELQALERASVSREQSVRLVNEALELYDESSVGEMFKEMTKVASELRAKVDTLKTRRMKASESAKVERLNNHGKEFSAMTSDGKLEDLEKFQAELRKM
ncbi:PREDICTED: protein MIS12 homolog isoform X2 [Camelina sativa]|uniref:Protein MIS12 homolog isoform X2 n=1 Tax=Camelina sativa TaxID=90675 RepID=A0ABM1QJ15_CAMSA|nr:PREDICTED: protein MIS12 homolog isoform X2 [Camelina sativa]